MYGQVLNNIRGHTALHYLLTSLLLILSFSASIHHVQAQPFISPAPQARVLEVLGAINLDEVNVVFQSRDGYIWLGSNKGLIRYDGYAAKRFFSSPDDKFSLSHNTVTAIAEDNHGKLWIGTAGGGLNLFDPLTETFRQINLALDSNATHGFDTINHLAIDTQQQLWVAGQQGLKHLNVSSQTTQQLPKSLDELTTTQISHIYFDTQSQVWLLAPSGNLHHFDGQNLTSYALSSSSTVAVNDIQIHDIAEDKKGNLWLGTSRGLHRFERQSKQFTVISPSFEDAFNIPDSVVQSLAIDHLGRIWLGSQNSGVYLYQPQTNQFKPISGEQDLFEQYEIESVNDIFSDSEGSLWLATDDGIVLVAKAAMNINALTTKARNLSITDVETLSDGKIAFAGNYQFYDYDIVANKASGRFANQNRLFRLSKTDNGDVLLATLGQGLQKYSAEEYRLVQMPHAKAMHSNTPVLGLFDAFIDKQQQVWLLPFPDLPHLAGGIILLDQQTRQYQTILSSPFISDVVQLNDDELLLWSDSAGLISLNTQTRTTTRWQQNDATAPKRVFSLFKDSNNVLWLGTRDQGLAMYDQATQQFIYFTEQDGLLSNNINSIIEDQRQNLWLGSDNGLTRFNPLDKSVMNLQQQNGLPFNVFNNRSANITEDGQLVFGTVNGLVTLDPQDFTASDTTASVFISDFKLFNQSVDWRNNDENTLLSQPIRFTKALTLTHEHDMVSFEFAAMEYVHPEAIRFAYKMEDLNQDWLYVDAKQRFASYTTLPSGDYTLRVKATDRYGNWSDKEASIKITVLPPWWLSWSAYAVYAIVIALGVVLFINLRTKKLVQRAMELELNVAQRTQELQRSRDQVTELLAQKQQLFASVSHEFRTPLTLILSPIEQLLKDPRGVPVTKELGLIKRNSRRLLRMVDQLLEFAKLELKDDSQMERVSLKQTLDIIISSFEPLVETKQIGLHVAPYEDVTLNMLPDSLNKIVINILSNAFKYSPVQSDIYVTVEQDGQAVNISIRDTGIGISEDDIEAVFQRFNRATHAHGETIPGAGIGLALVKELVEANFGRITLQSVLNEGSTFTVTLPICQSSLIDQKTENSDLEDVIHQHLDLEIDSVNTAETGPVERQQVVTNDDLKSILIVDDNPDLRDLLNQQLSMNYQCLLAENGQKGLEIAREQLPDLVISDVMMPVMDGYQLTTELKNDELTSHIPVILLTAKGSMESRLKGLQLLVDDYLAKPFNMEELSLRINNILTIRDIVKQKFRQVIEQNDPSPQMEKLSVSDSEQAFVKRVNEHLSNFYTNPEFTAKLLSREIGVSERQLQRKLKAQFDLSFPELVRNYRLNKAVEMLTSGQRASQIYHLVGFSSHSYFSSCFKAKFGQTPKEYQQVN